MKKKQKTHHGDIILGDKLIEYGITQESALGPLTFL